jgi:predicted  nucleic acid-binding Zn-ribbon protein
MRRDEIEKRMQVLAERRAETERELRDAQRRLAELEDERNALCGTLALRRRAVEDFAAFERQLEKELAAVEYSSATGRRGGRGERASPTSAGHSGPGVG